MRVLNLLSINKCLKVNWIDSPGGGEYEITQKQRREKGEGGKQRGGERS